MFDAYFRRYKWRQARLSPSDIKDMSPDCVILPDSPVVDRWSRLYMGRPKDGTLQVMSRSKTAGLYDFDDAENEDQNPAVGKKRSVLFEQSWADLTFHQFVSWVESRTDKKASEQFRCADGTVLSISNKRKIVTHPHLMPGRDIESYAYALLKLYTPWRDMDDVYFFQNGTKSTAVLVLLDELKRKDSRLCFDVKRIDFTTKLADLLEKIEIHAKHPGFGLPEVDTGHGTWR